MKNIGIWLDKDKAIIVTLKKDQERLKVLESNVEHFRIHGGSGTRLKGGPQDVVQDSKYLEREKHQLKKYFENIAAMVSDADSILIFGPAETGQKFAKELSESYKDIGTKVQAVQRADSMTNNQVKAWVRNFFK